jgi:hypothetical protein
VRFHHRGSPRFFQACYCEYMRCSAAPCLLWCLRRVTTRSLGRARPRTHRLPFRRLHPGQVLSSYFILLPLREDVALTLGELQGTRGGLWARGGVKIMCFYTTSPAWFEMYLRHLHVLRGLSTHLSSYDCREITRPALRASFAPEGSTHATPNAWPHVRPTLSALHRPPCCPATPEGPAMLPRLFTASLVVTGITAPLVTAYIVNPSAESR